MKGVKLGEKTTKKAKRHETEIKELKEIAAKTAAANNILSAKVWPGGAPRRGTGPEPRIAGPGPERPRDTTEQPKNSKTRQICCLPRGGQKG